MQCGAARKFLYLSNRGSPAEPPSPEDVAQARAHVAICAACREFLASEECLRALVKARSPKEGASAALRETVLTRIAEERARALPADSRRAVAGFRGPLAWALAALLLACGIVGGLWLVGYRNQVAPQPLIMLLVEDHLGNLSRATEIATSDPATMQKWFQQKVGFTFRLPATTEPQLIGGRLCFLQGRKAALIWYRHPQSRVSLFILDAADVEFAENQAITLDGKRCVLDARKGLNVVLWKERGLLYGLVSDVRSAELLQLAAKF